VGKRTYRLHVQLLDKKTDSARLEGSDIHLRLSSRRSEGERQTQTGRLIARCIAAEHLPELQTRLQRWNDRCFGRKLGTIRFKNNRSNWGSCSRKGNINISTRLLLAPEKILDYVCVHELAHLIQPKHGPEFWRIVGRILPDYPERRRWLRENGKNCCF
jgi:predicted metal-dependent hydrolase